MTPADRVDALISLAPAFALSLLCLLVVWSHLDNAAGVIDQWLAERREAKR